MFRGDDRRRAAEPTGRPAGATPRTRGWTRICCGADRSAARQLRARPRRTQAGVRRAAQGGSRCPTRARAALACKRAALLFALHTEPEVQRYFADEPFARDLYERVLPFLVPRFLKHSCQSPEAFVGACVVLADMWEGEPLGNWPRAKRRGRAAHDDAAGGDLHEGGRRRTLRRRRPPGRRPRTRAACSRRGCPRRSGAGPPLHLAVEEGLDVLRVEGLLRASRRRCPSTRGAG